MSPIVEQIEKFLSNPILWGIVAAIALAVSLSGKFSVTASTVLMWIAWAMASFGVYRIFVTFGFDLSIRMLASGASACVLAIGALLVVRWMNSKSPEIAPPIAVKQEQPLVSPQAQFPHDSQSNKSSRAPRSKSAIKPNVIFSQTHNGIGGMVMFNEADEPIDNVSFSIMRSHAGPEHEADPSLLQKDLDSTVSVNVGTLLPQLATPIKAIPASMFPYSDKPSSYQVNIFTRYEAFTEYLYVTPKEGTGKFDQFIDLSSNKTHVWIYKNAEKARKNWKNWPEWWK